MKTLNAIKKMNALGPVTITKCGAKMETNGRVITISHNSGSDEIHTIHVRRVNDISDSMTDYFAGWFPSNMKRALAYMVEVSQ